MHTVNGIIFRWFSNNPDCRQGVIALDSEFNKKSMRRYNLSFNFLIFLIVLIFFGLFFKVYDDYKGSQISDFIEYGVEQTAIVAKEIEDKLWNTLVEIHMNLEALSQEDINRKHEQIANAHPEIRDVFRAANLDELKSLQLLQSDTFQKTLDNLVRLELTENVVYVSETIFDEDDIYLLSLSRDTKRGYILSIINFRNAVQNTMRPISFLRYRGAYILDEKSNILYHYQPEMIGLNVFDDFQSESLKEVHQSMQTKETGHGFYRLDWIIEENVYYNKITAWNTLRIGNRTFKIARTAELDEMNKELKNLRNSGLILIILIFTTLSVLSLLNLKFQTRLLRSISEDLKAKLEKKTREV